MAFDLDLLGAIIGAILTLMLFSYLLGDNVLYRWALALLVGCGVGYALAMAWTFVVRNWLALAMDPAQSTNRIWALIPLLLGALLLLKGFSSTRSLASIAILGNIPLAFLLGTGAGVAVSGALVGTVVPLALATGRVVSLQDGMLNLALGLLTVLGTITALLVFTHRTDNAESGPKPFFAGIQRIGRVFLAAALGVSFAGMVTSALTTLVLRLWEITNLVNELLILSGG